MRLHNTSTRRQGTITVIVVAFLGLLFILALTFVFYSTAESDTAKVYRDYANVDGGTASDLGSPPDPVEIFNYGFGQLIYGAPEDQTGAFSTIRGHELARTIYGWNPLDPNGNNQAFNGVGLVDQAIVHADIAGFPQTMVNHSWHFGANFPGYDPRVAGLMHDPDNNGSRDPRQPLPTTVPPTYRAYAKNANYTYPDANNMFLAAVDPTSGRVIIPSFHRPWLMKNSSTGMPSMPPNVPIGQTVGLPAFNPADPDPWTNPYGRLYSLRPRPADHRITATASEFPYPQWNYSWNGTAFVPDGTYGDVENLEGKVFPPGHPTGKQFDSVWVDMNFPVRRWQGKNYKPLVAFLVLDLDGRVNLNTAGNFNLVPGSSPPTFAHYSNQGVGPWEVNPSTVMFDYRPIGPTPPNPPPPFNDTRGAAQLTRALYSTAAPFPVLAPSIHNRYGWDSGAGNSVPNRFFRHSVFENPTANMPPGGTGAHFYGQVDYNGFTPTPMSVRYSDNSTGRQSGLVFGSPFVGNATTPADPPRPDATSPFDNGIILPPNAPFPGYDERSNHPSLYNPYFVGNRRFSRTSGSSVPDRAFGVEEVRHLNLRYNGGSYTGSDLATVSIAFANNQFNLGEKNSRFLTTTISNDLNKPGATPWLPAINNTYTLPATPGATPVGAVQTMTPTPSVAPATTGGDFDTAYRSFLGLLGPVDINRKLTDYRTNPSLPLSATNTSQPIQTKAANDRQALAGDIFDRLLMVTIGTTRANMHPVGHPSYNAQRWLAQLAVNIVDYLDNDEIITAFNWNSTQSASVQNGWVYGFERPRLVMNEIYNRYENDTTDPGEAIPMSMNRRPQTSPTQKGYTMRTWLELHNPITPMSPAEQNMDPMGDDLGANGGYRAKLEEINIQTGMPQSAFQILAYKVQLGGGAGADPLGLNSGITPNAHTNPTGTPGQGGTPLPAAVQPLPPIQFTGPGVVQSTTKTIQPNIGAQANGQSFYLIGPAEDGTPAQLPGAVGVTAQMTHRGLQAELQPGADVNVGTNRPTWAPAFVLQRLANPYLQPNPQSNPYITTDYIDADQSGISMHDRVLNRFDGTRGPSGPEMAPQDLNTNYSWGRRQPYDGRINYADPVHFRQGQMAPGPMGQLGGHSFAGHNMRTAGNWPAPAAPGSASDESPGNQTNDTLQYPFMPLVHLDRIVLNPAELVHVTACKPHEFTKLFHMSNTTPTNGRKVAYTADWFDMTASGPTSTFLFRALDFLAVPHTMAAQANGGRVPGKVNINTMPIQDVFNAIADPSPANRFTGPQVTQAWNQLTQLIGRSSGQWNVGETDKPFRGSAAPVEVAGAPVGTNANSMDRMLFKNGATYTNSQNAEDFTSGGGNAGTWQKYEMLSKMFNQFTTRSNTFAVYATIGYFEVKNDGPYTENNRPILGRELGTDTGNITRHKFFSIVDRTNIARESTNVPIGTPNKQGDMPIYLPFLPCPMPSVPSPFADPDTTNPAEVGPGIIPAPPAPNAWYPPNPLAALGAPLNALSPQTGAAVMVMMPITGISPGSAADWPSPAAPPPAPATSITRSISGIYDGVPWTLYSGSTVLIEANGNAEIAYVVLPYNAADTSGSARVILVSPNPVFANRFHRGATIRILQQDPTKVGTHPGNPGPQPGFNFKAARYAPVVKYAEQTQ